jgi:hypothetical protein
MNKLTLVSLVAMVAAASGASAGTKLQTNVAPTPPDCFIAGSFCLNSGASCSIDNSECALASVSPRSSVSLTGKLQLKGSFRDVRDNLGALVTTGVVGSADNYVVQIGLQSCTVDNSEMPYCGVVNQDVFVKLALTKGKGSFKLDLRPVFPLLTFTEGTPLRINHVALITPRAGGNCLGTNSGTDLLARLNDATCNDGIGILGVGGIQIQP